MTKPPEKSESALQPATAGDTTGRGGPPVRQCAVDGASVWRKTEMVRFVTLSRHGRNADINAKTAGPGVLGQSRPGQRCPRRRQKGRFARRFQRGKVKGGPNGPRRPGPKTVAEAPCQNILGMSRKKAGGSSLVYDQVRTRLRKEDPWNTARSVGMVQEMDVKGVFPRQSII